MQPSLDEIRRLVGLQLGARSVEADTRIIEDLGADSFDVLNIVSTLEERFAVSFGDDEMTAIDTVADLHAAVRRKLER